MSTLQIVPPILVTPPKRSPKKKVLFSQFPLLSDDLLFGILFSGYLGYSYKDLFHYKMISKRIWYLGRRRIGLLELDGNDMERVLQLMADERGLSKVVSLKVNFSNVEFTQGIVKNILTWKSSLKNISFRGSMIDDVSLLQLLSPEFVQLMDENEGKENALTNNSLVDQPCPFPHLVSLDLSKDTKAKSHLINDTGLSMLTHYPNLLWISLAYTNITDQTIALICSSLVQLKHLNIQGCYGVTNASGGYLRQTSLLRLDVSNCPLLGQDFFVQVFGNNREPLCQSLELLSCSFLPEFTIRELRLVATCPKLLALECRSRHQRQNLIGAVEWMELRQRIKVLIIDHKDQIEYLRYKPTMMPTEPHFPALWSFYDWPYQSANRLL